MSSVPISGQILPFRSAPIRGKPSCFSDHEITRSPDHPISISVIRVNQWSDFAFPISAMTCDVGVPENPVLAFWGGMSAITAIGALARHGPLPVSLSQTPPGGTRFVANKGSTSIRKAFQKAVEPPNSCFFGLESRASSQQLGASSICCQRSRPQALQPIAEYRILPFVRPMVNKKNRIYLFHPSEKTAKDQRPAPK